MIRQATQKDMPRVLELIHELAIYEKEPEAVLITVEDLIRDGFGDDPQFICFVLEDNGIIHGMALVYSRYSTWEGRVLHLEDLIVSEKSRGKGYGGSLLDYVVQYGYDLGVGRISWEVLDCLMQELRVNLENLFFQKVEHKKLEIFILSLEVQNPLLSLY